MKLAYEISKYAMLSNLQLFITGCKLLSQILVLLCSHIYFIAYYLHFPLYYHSMYTYWITLHRQMQY